MSNSGKGRRVGIDWKNLVPLPLKRQRDASDRERLADASFRNKRANHKGRLHFYAYQKRQMAKAKKLEDAKTVAIKRSKAQRFKDAARAYWRGERADHPK